MLSCVKLDGHRCRIDESYIDTHHKSHFFHAKRGEVTDELKYTSNTSTQHIIPTTWNSGAHTKRRFWRKGSFISRTLKPQRGTSLIEVVVAMLILSILIVGAHYHFVYGRGQIALRRNYRAALHLAAQKIEELKAGNYNDITNGKKHKTMALGKLSCNRCTDVNDVGLYKKINVNINWNQMGKEHNMSLDTFIAPKW
jgi:prepilin-type N-terminal cleavage/methylation domain-containing protein